VKHIQGLMEMGGRLVKVQQQLDDLLKITRDASENKD
jgi:hypothetical protein